MIRPRAALFASFVAATLVAGCRSAGGCKPGEAVCYCPEGASCTQRCSGAGCALVCGNRNGTCALEGGDGCMAACQNAQTCTAACGKGSTVACQHVARSCTASVGDASRVHCEGAARCDVSCAASCDVDCPGGHCRVRCVDPASCRLSCDGPTTTCPDGTTKTCGMPC